VSINTKKNGLSDISLENIEALAGLRTERVEKKNILLGIVYIIPVIVAVF
jgi:hypothetical protein